ncbi:MAG: ThuA domain-containing protein, partial [Anaerolineae bacterium]|nr:ThuA domain-containing protein [Anaerolineae bacterium]
MRILVIGGDHSHPAVTVRGGLAPLAAKGYELDWIEDAADWAAEQMADYPLVILSKSNNATEADQTPWVTPDVEQAFADYVRGGGGLLVLHSGTVYSDTETLRPIMGGTFVEHPPQCDVAIEPTDGHPLTAGVSAFTAMDEHYHITMEEGVTDIFLTTTSEHGTQPGGWTRTEGAGRVCVLTPGHNVELWLEPAYQTLLDNVMRWCT